MKTLIVGGAGFIGSHVVKYAQSQGHEAVVWDLPAKDIRDPTIAEFDLSARHASYDMVIIEAAVTAEAEFVKHPSESFTTNVMGLLNVLEGCRRGNVPRVAFASSSAVYGLTTKRSSEEDELRPHNSYAASKMMGEFLCKRYSSWFGITILRYFNTYGLGENSKGDYKSIISIFLESIRRDGEVTVYGDGDQRRDFIEVRDAARITLELAMRASGTFNVGTGITTSWNEIITILKENGLDFKVRYIPNPISNYQSFTKADVSKLVSQGVRARIPIAEGIRELMRVSVKEAIT